jgi:CDP-diacylglycerol pyrophosphatase
LHIHIDCLAADTHEALMRYRSTVGAQWTPFPVSLAGRMYYAMAVAGDDLGAVNPFELLSTARFPDAQFSDTQGANLVVVGSRALDGVPGFLILANRADDGSGNTSGGEDLQDHDSCPAPEPLTGLNAK